MGLEPEFKPILDRKEHKQDFDNHFSEVGILFRDITNYGSNLIPRCFSSSKRKLEDIIVIGTLLKQVVAMIDAAEILISNAAIYPAHLQARAGFEASLYIDWILKNDSEQKAKYFYVSNLREDRLWALRVTGDSPDQAQFDQLIEEIGSKLKESIYTTKNGMKEEAKSQIDKIDQILSGQSFKDINIDIKNYKSRKKLPYEPSWYNPLGIASVRQMAIDVNRLPEYDIFYSLTSQVMHSSRYRNHIQFGNGTIIFEPIRCLEGIETFTHFTVQCILKTYIAVLKHYRPDELPAFGRKYAEDWRNAFLNVKSVKYSAAPNSKII